MMVNVYFCRKIARGETRHVDDNYFTRRKDACKKT